MIKTEDLPYNDGPTACNGFLAFDDTLAGKRPGVLVVHEAFGLGEHAMERARMLAKEGYVALAADLFGGRRQIAPADLMDVIGGLMADPPKLRGRAKAALSALAARPEVDAAKLFGIGFCFGGTTVLELARDGVGLLGVVGFHSGLQTGAPAQPGKVKASVLALIGADDGLIPAEQRLAFEAEMRKAGADWQLTAYGNTRHSFTNPDADGTVMPDIVYDAKADQRSWRAMLDFFAERLKA